jgi:poly(3-hydroxybutyrate) depolymerase
MQTPQFRYDASPVPPLHVGGRKEARPAAGLLDAPPVAVLDLFNRSGRQNRKPAFRIRPPVIDGRTVEVRIVPVHGTPFGNLLRFERDIERDDPVVLLVSPLSGHHATLLSDVVEALLPDHDVHIIDWSDGRDVPVSAGRFGLDELFDTIMEFARVPGRRAHLMGMSQSGMPVLAVGSLMAAMEDPLRPKSMTIMGAMIDMRVNVTRVDALLKTRTIYSLVRTLLAEVPAHCPGAGRRVHSSAAQFSALALYLMGRLSPFAPTPLHVFQSNLVGEGDDPADLEPFYNEFLTLMDLPAELHMEVIRALFHDYSLARGLLNWRGRKVDPGALRDIGLFTVESERDETSGIGQTRAAHDLCTALPERLHRHHLEAGAGHLGMFHGRHWRDHVLPLFRDFVRVAETA